MWRFLLPIALLAALIALFWRGLSLNPGEIPSPLIGKPVPAFSLPVLGTPGKQITDQDLRGKVSLVNVWGTWCFACRDEHETLMKLANEHVVPIYGIDWKDDRKAALAWLKEKGDPYVASAFDSKGDVAINWGVYGAPETFLVDAGGIIRYKYIGPLTDDVLKDKLLPRIRKLQETR